MAHTEASASAPKSASAGKAGAGKLRSMRIEPAANGGYIVTFDYEAAKPKKGDATYMYEPAKPYAIADRAGLDALLDEKLGKAKQST